MTNLAVDQIILLSAALLGALAAGFALLASREATADTEVDTATGGWSGLIAGWAVAALLFLATLASRPPFSPGGRLGAGLVFGALSATVMVLAARRARRSRGASLMLAGSISLLAAAGTMFAYRGNPADALFGLALGQAVVALFAAPRRADGTRGGGWGPVEMLPLMTVLLAAGVALAIARYEEFPAAERLALGEKLWWTGPVLVFGSLLVGQIAALALARGATARLLIVAVASAIVLAIFTVSYPRYLPLLPAVGAGYVSGALLAALAASPSGPGGALLGAGIALAVLVVAYRFTAGYGIALAALGFAGTALAWPVAEAQGPDTEGVLDDDTAAEAPASPLPLAALALLAFAALFRVYYVRYDLDETSVFLTAHYTLIGLIIGALAPQALAMGRESRVTGHESRVTEHAPVLSTRDPRLVTRDLLVLAVALGLPALMVVFWGIRACAGLLLGLSLGQAYLLWVRLLEGDSSPGIAARLARAAGVAPTLLLALTCTQALSLFDDYAGLLTRTHRIAIVLIIAALFPIATLIRTLNRRRIDS
jgi:hypothetical protein